MGGMGRDMETAGGGAFPWPRDGSGVALSPEAADRLGGERARLAKFVSENGPKIRAIARRKLSERARSWTDSEDIVGSVFLRLDGYLQKGDLRYEEFDDLWPLIAVIAERRAIDRSRLAANAMRLFSDQEDGAHLVAAIETRPDLDATELVLRLLAKIDTGQDRQLMMLMLRGVRSPVAGSLLGLQPPSVRARWSRLCRRLADELREEAAR